MEDLDKIHKCINCGKAFTNKEVGLMNCMTHLLKLNHFNRSEHYDCCGASTNQDDFIHYEASKPRGCHRVDHVSSKEEFDNILEKPFICILKSAAEKLTITSKGMEVKQHFVSISTKESLDYSYGFRMPFKKIYQIDIKKVYENLLDRQKGNSSILKNRENISSDQFYVYSQEEHDDSIYAWLKIGNSSVFNPFCIIRRMDYLIDKEKKEEIKSWEQCSFY